MSPARGQHPGELLGPSIGSPVSVKSYSSGRNSLAPGISSGPLLGFGTGVVGKQSSPPETEVPVPIGEDVLALQVRVRSYTRLYIIGLQSFDLYVFTVDVLLKIVE